MRIINKVIDVDQSDYEWERELGFGLVLATSKPMSHFIMFFQVIIYLLCFRS